MPWLARDERNSMWPTVWMHEDEIRTMWRVMGQERRSDMRAVEYELWVTEKRDGKGVEVIRKEERLGARREIFTDLEPGDSRFREEVLEEHIGEFENADLKFADIEVRARPFP